MKQIKKSLIFIVKLGVTILLVYFIARKVGIREIQNSFVTIRSGLIIAFGFSILFNILKAYKWYCLIREVKSPEINLQNLGNPGELTIGNAFKSYFSGMAGGILTPGRVGEIARIVYLEKQPKSLIAYLVAVDKLFDVAVVLIMSLPGVLYFFKLPGIIGLFPILVLLVVIIYLPHLPVRWLNHLLKNTTFLMKKRERLDMIESGLQSISFSFKVKFLSITILSYGVVIWEFQQLVSNYQECGFMIALLCQPLIMLTNILPFTIGGIGVREGTAVILLAGFGIARTHALSAAFMLFVLNTAIPALIGVMLLFFRKNEAKK